jgi:GNAT superfamily N-acetyltransferase
MLIILSNLPTERAHLPKTAQRNQPDPVPALLLGQLAVDQRWQGKGVARSLMFFALSTAVRLSQEIGCFCVLTHPLDDRIRSFYRGFGLETLPGDPSGGMAVRMADVRASGF